MEQDQRQLIKKYIDLFLGRKKIIIICTLVAIVVGIAFYLQSPKRYKATSLIIYQRQKINLSELSPNVKTRTKEMVATLTQQVTSRTSLERIIKQFDLYKKRLERLPMEDVITLMRDNVYIHAARGDVFQVEFLGDSPKKVMLVTNAIASKFIEENLLFREEQATETSSYVKEELEMAKETLDKKEVLMRDYKLKNYNQMPQQLQINMSRLNSLQLQLQSNQQGQRDLERTKVLIQEQISSRVEVIERGAGFRDGSATASNSVEGQQISLTALQNKRTRSETEEKLLQSFIDLESLQSKEVDFSQRYTDKHPELKRVKKLLANKEKEHEHLMTLALKEKSSAIKKNALGEDDSLRSQSKYRSLDSSFNQLSVLKLQMKEVSMTIKTLKESEKKLMDHIEIYKKWIGAAPIKEAEWSALTRDYEQLSMHYQKLVSRSLNADSAESLERRQKGSQFKIVDSAHLPEKPFTPNFLKIMLLALGIGCGIGAGTALILETVQTSFKEALDLESYLDIPVICSIPFVSIRSEQKKEKTKVMLWWSAFIVVTSAIIIGTLYLLRIGLIIV